jgi:hypothetical protein
MNPAAVHRKQPVKDFNTGGHGNKHCHNAKEGINVCAGAHSKEMVQPDNE